MTVVWKLESPRAMGGHPHRTKQTNKGHPLGTTEGDLSRCKKEANKRGGLVGDCRREESGRNKSD